MKVIKLFYEVFVEMVKSAEYYVVKRLKATVTLLRMFFPLLLIYYRTSIVESIVWIILIELLCRYNINMYYRINNVTERGFPLPEHRYTERNESGVISINENETQDAILYLCDVEEYLKSKGML